MSTALPAGLAADDIVLCEVTDESATTWSVAWAAGWTEIVDDPLVSGVNSLQFAAAWARKGAGALSTSHTVTNGVIPRISYYAFSGVDTASTPVWQYSEGNGSKVFTGVTAALGLLVLVEGHYNWAPLTPPSGMTERYDSAESHYMCDQQVTAGATGTRTITGSDIFGGYLISLAEAGGAGPAYPPSPVQRQRINALLAL